MKEVVVIGSSLLSAFLQSENYSCKMSVSQRIIDNGGIPGFLRVHTCHYDFPVLSVEFVIYFFYDFYP